MHSVAYISCHTYNIQVVIKNSISFIWVCHKSRVSTNNSCDNLCVEHPSILCGKLCVICVATYVYDTLLCLWQLMCYMCGNLCVRHLLFSGNFYITSVATSYKFFFGNSCAWHFFWSLRQLLCITNYDFMINFFFSWQLK